MMDSASGCAALAMGNKNQAGGTPSLMRAQLVGGSRGLGEGGVDTAGWLSCLGQPLASGLGAGDKAKGRGQCEREGWIAREDVVDQWPGFWIGC